MAREEIVNIYLAMSLLINNLDGLECNNLPGMAGYLTFMPRYAEKLKAFIRIRLVLFNLKT